MTTREGLNVVHLTGYVTGKTLLSEANNGAHVLRFKLSTPRRIKDGDDWKTVKDINDIVVWGWKGKALANRIGHGSHLYIGGVLRYWTREDKKLKIKITTGSVQAESVVFLGGKPSAV